MKKLFLAAVLAVAAPLSAYAAPVAAVPVFGTSASGGVVFATAGATPLSQLGPVETPITGFNQFDGPETIVAGSGSVNGGTGISGQAACTGCQVGTLTTTIQGFGALAGISFDDTVSISSDDSGNFSAQTTVMGMFDLANLSAFVGTGVVDGGFNVISSFTGVVANFQANQGASSTIELRGIPTVAAVPLPASLPLALGGVALLAGLSRRRARG